MSSEGSGSAGSGTAPSQTHHVQCKYCDEKPLIKNYKTHLKRKHKDQNPSDKAGKGQQSISVFVKAGPSGKRSRSSDDGGSKKRHCSGDSAIDIGEDEPEDEPEACENVTNVNRESRVEEEVAASLVQQSSSIAGGSGRPGQVGKLSQDFGSTSLEDEEDDKSNEEAHDDVRNVNIIVSEDETPSLPTAQSPLSSFQIPLLEEIKKIAHSNEMKLDLILQGNFHKDAVYQEKARDDEETKVLSRNDKAGMIVCRQAYSHIKMRRPKQDFEKELFLLSKAGVDIGTLNHSAIFIDKFRPVLDKTIRLQITNFFSTPTIPTGFTPALAYTGMFACYNFILEQIL